MKIKKHNKSIIFFYIIAFTITILIFSIGSSILTNEKELSNMFSADNNKVLLFKVESDISIQEIENVLSDFNVTFWGWYLDSITDIEITTQFMTNAGEVIINMKEGDKSTFQNLNGNECIISSSLLDNEILVQGFSNASIKLIPKASFWGIKDQLYVTEDLFVHFLGTTNVTHPYLFPIISGDAEEVQRAIQALEVYVKDINPNNTIETEGYLRYYSSDYGQLLYKASILIIFITIINTVSLSSLWIEGRKKEFAIRKAVGAKNKDLLRLFQKELFIIAIFSSVLSLTIHLILVQVTGGEIFNLNISLTINNFIYAVVISIFVAYITSLPVLKGVQKVEPYVLLRED